MGTGRDGNVTCFPKRGKEEMKMSKKVILGIAISLVLLSGGAAHRRMAVILVCALCLPATGT
jgi:hypothetical protein